MSKKKKRKHSHSSDTAVQPKAIQQPYHEQGIHSEDLIVPERKDTLIPYIMLGIIIVFTLFIRIADIGTAIKGNQNFSMALQEDEDFKVRHTLQINWRKDKKSLSDWLMHKGGTTPIIYKNAFNIVNGNNGLKNIFHAVFKVPLNSATGYYYFFRSLSVIASLLTIVIVFLLGAAVTDNYYVGALSALLFATLTGTAFYAVIYKSDTFVVFLSSLMLYYTVLYIKKPLLHNAIIMCALFPIVFGSKYNGIFSGIAIITAFLINYIHAKTIPFSDIKQKGISVREALELDKLPWSHIVWGGVAAFISLMIFAPFIPFDAERFYYGIRKISIIQSSNASVEFAGLGFKPVVIISHLLNCSIGIILSIAFVIAVGYGIYLVIKKKQKYYRIALLVIFIIVQYIVLIRAAWIVVRYSFLFYPAMVVLIAVTVFAIATYAKKKSGVLYTIVVVSLVILSILHVGRFLAFNKLLSKTTTTIQASHWINEHIDEDASILDIRVFESVPIIFNLKQTNIKVIGRNQESVLCGKENPFSLIPTDYILVTERTFRDYYRLQSHKKYGKIYTPYRLLFDKLLYNPDKFQLVKKFEIVPEIFGITFKKPYLPQDMVLFAPDVYLYKRIQPVQQ